MKQWTKSTSAFKVTMKVSRAQVREFSIFEFFAEASELGFAVGVAPGSLETDLGNGLALVLQRVDNHGNLVYRQQSGCINLTIFND